MSDPVVEPAAMPAERPVAADRPRSRRRWLVLALWLVAFSAALALDRPVATWVARVQPIKWHDWHLKLFKRAGDFRYTAAVVVAVAVFHRRRWRAGALLLAASATAGVLYNVKWVIGRHRPSRALEPFTFHPFKGGPHGFLSAENLAMPSGHTCLAFATAHALGYLLPRWRLGFYVMAALVGVERVMENAHYVSDVVAGAALGVFSAYLVIKFLGPKLGMVPTAGLLPPLPCTRGRGPG